MRTTSNRVLDSREFPYTNQEPTLVAALKEVAQGFSHLQQDCQFADYNLTREIWDSHHVGKVQRRNVGLDYQ